MADFFGKGKVAVLKTSPETVMGDIQSLMRRVGFEQSLPKTTAPVLSQYILANGGTLPAHPLPGKSRGLSEPYKKLVTRIWWESTTTRWW